MTHFTNEPESSGLLAPKSGKYAVSDSTMSPKGKAVVHDLKCQPPFFDDVVALRKPFEIRKNDRNYQVGDVLRLREYVVGEDDFGGDDRYTGRECLRRVSYITGYEQRPGFVVMGLSAAPIEPETALSRGIKLARGGEAPPMPGGFA